MGDKSIIIFMLTLLLVPSVMSVNFGYNYLNPKNNNPSATSFISLDDTPFSYAGESGKCLRVNSDENGIEFVVCSTGGQINETQFEYIDEKLNINTSWLDQRYNDTSLVLDINGTLWSYIKTNEGGWFTTYNSTYDSFSQDVLANRTLWFTTYNSTYDLISQDVLANRSLWFTTYNSTYDLISQDVLANRSLWFTTYNETYANINSSRWGLNVDDIYYNDGKVGIGTTTPTHPLHVIGNIKLDLPVVSEGAFFELRSASSRNFSTYFGTTAGNQYAWLTNVRYNGTAWNQDNSSLTGWRMNQVVADNNASSHIAMTFFDNNLAPVSPLYITGERRVGVMTTSTPSTTFQVGTTMYVNDTNGRVGVGTSSPSSKVHIYNGAGGGSSPTSSADILTVENNDNNYINIISPTDKQGGILFSDNVRARGYLAYSHATDNMRFFTAGSERLTIGSDGRVGIGTTSPSHTLNVMGDTNLSGAVFVGGDIHARGYIHNRGVNNGISFQKGTSYRYWIDDREDSESLVFSVGSTPGSVDNVLSVNRRGRVGVGVGSPNYTLHVLKGVFADGTSAMFQGTSSTTGLSRILIANTNTTGGSTSVSYMMGGSTLWSAGYEGYTQAFQIEGGFTFSNNPPFAITKTTGRVGLGTNNPSHTLNVIGDTNITQDLYVGDDLFVADSVGVGTQTLTGKLNVYSDNSGSITNINVENVISGSTATSYGVKSVMSGVASVSQSVYGIYGEVPTASAPKYNYAIYGKAPVSTTSWAGYFEGKLQATDYYSGDGSQGITNTASYWLCTNSLCTARCQVSIKDGLIVGCT